LLGNHTDYNQGLVLAAAIDRGISVEGAARVDRAITIKSLPFGKRAEASLDSLQPLTRERWANYALGVVSEFVRAGHVIDGFDANVAGNLPVGVGVSSSAAFEVATAFFIMKLQQFGIPPLEVAKLCQRAENVFVGVRSGLLDQVTSIFGRADQVVFLDCRTEQIRTIPFPSDLSLIIADSGKKHSLIAGEYNARREECLAAAYALRASSLRDVNLRQLASAETSLDPVLFRRAQHIVGENDRVSRAIIAMHGGDEKTLGELMYESHESSRVNFENSTDELDLLVAIARETPGVLGARLTGGGFGGGTLTLVKRAFAEEVAEKMNRIYMKRAGRTANAFVCRIADGAAIQNA